MTKKRRTSKKRKSGSNYTSRNVNTREVRQSFLIVCEGEQTEPNYFRSFDVNASVRVVGSGDNTMGVVEKAIELREDEEYDQVWCVFDRDSFPPERFNSALAKAKNKNINVAYSNEAFELWYLLHFNYYDTAISRHDYQKMLTELLDGKYQKNSKTMYEELESRQPDAIRNAKTLLLKQNYPANPAWDNPSTTVHLLVEQLNRFLRGKRS